MPTAAEVLKAARLSEVKPNWERAFIADTWRKLGKPGTLDEFKEHLWTLHRGSALSLSRAELVAVLGEKRVNESAFLKHGAEFNFIGWTK